MAEIRTTVLEKKLVALNTVEVYFSVPDSFSFIAGQYISVTIPALEGLETREQFRDFSISSPPSLKGRIRITFRNSDSIFKTTLLENPGLEVILEGPAGIFTLPESATQPVVAIASGIGITPFMSMASEKSNALELIYYNNSPESAPYLQELGQLLGNKLHEHYTPPGVSHLQALHSRNPGALWYVAGSAPMVTTIRQFLKTLTVDDTMIRTEEFSGYE